MKTLLLYILVLLTVLVALLTTLGAAEPDPVQEALSRKSGKVLILVNERTMEGEITHIGSQYRVRRTVGETWVPARQVMYLCQTMEEALSCLRHRANLEDADERLRLANWCRLHRLREQALVEIRAAAQLSPHNQAIHRLLEHLEKSSAASAPLQPVKHEELAVPSLTVSDETLGAFACRVQPILMNACARCHSSDKGGAFRLAHAYEIGIGDRRITQYNLAATLAQVNPRQPEASLLLVRSVSVHGPMTQAPLRSRQTHAFRTLEEWIRKTIDDNPQLREMAASPTPPPVEKPVVIVPAVQRAPVHENTPWGIDAPQPQAPTPPAGAPAGAVPPAAAPAAPPPQPQGVPPRLFPEQMPTSSPAHEDPYDPEPFNRQAHPPEAAPAPKP